MSTEEKKGWADLAEAEYAGHKEPNTEGKKDWKEKLVGILTVVGLWVAVAVAVFLIVTHNSKLKDENTRLKANQEALLAENTIYMAKSQAYKVADSLNAAKVTDLELTIDEYKKYRADDWALINQLKSKGADLQKVISTQSNTIKALSAGLRDTIIADTIYNKVDTLKCFTYKSKWTDVSGRISRDSVNLSIANRESLKIIETITYKRFLGFLWKTSKIKDRQVNVLSENPATTIVNVECVGIEN